MNKRRIQHQFILPKRKCKSGSWKNTNFDFLFVLILAAVVVVKASPKRNHIQPSNRFNRLVFFLSFLLIRVNGVHSNLFVILLKCCQIFSGFAELALLHTFADVPVWENFL